MIFFQTQERVDFVCPTDGFFPMSPDACSATYYLCLSGVATEQVFLNFLMINIFFSHSVCHISIK